MQVSTTESTDRLTRQMDQEGYKKIGRGGAGNYYSKQDIDDAAKNAAEDVEAQITPHPSQLNTAVPTHAYSGRGGAGNLVKKDGGQRAGDTVVADTTPSLRESAVLPTVGYSGRGGAGNLRSVDVERKKLEDEMKAKEARERAHDEVVKAVDLDLKMPERAHLGSEKVE